jgi:hypothetical protein
MNPAPTCRRVIGNAGRLTGSLSKGCFFDQLSFRISSSIFATFAP